MKTTQNKEVYEAPKAEISIVSARDILFDSNGTEIDWQSYSYSQNF